MNSTSKRVVVERVKMEAASREKLLLPPSPSIPPDITCYIEARVTHLDGVLVTQIILSKRDIEREIPNIVRIDHSVTFAMNSVQCIKWELVGWLL